MQEEKKEITEEKKKNKQKTILITTIITSVVIIAGLVVAIIFLLREPELQPVIGEYDRNLGGRGIVVTEDNIEEVRRMLEEPLTDTHYEVDMAMDWTFPSSRRASPDAFFRNGESNTRTVFFELYLEDRSEVIHVSPYIPLGVTYKDIRLDANLPAGEYKALMTIFLVDDDFEIITTLQMHRPFTIER